MDQSNETPKKFNFCKGIKITPSSTPKIHKSINFAASLRKKNAFYLLPQNNDTPSPTNMPNRVVKNPFEMKSDKLRFPVISSPSLFHHVKTPQRTGNEEVEEFVWDIDEVSCIKPANFQAHETQFKENIDPELEARAQAAITTFFTEHQIVPSPVNCPLRKQKIVLKDDSFTSLMIVNSTAITPRKQITETNKVRSNSTQTVVTFPPNLPKEVEAVLEKYCTYNMDQEQEVRDHSLSESDCNKSTMEISTLRRKLFENASLPNDSDRESFDVSPSKQSKNLSVCLSPPPKSPQLGLNKHKSSLGLDKSFGSDMFGELSPIAASTGSSPQSSKKKKSDGRMSIDFNMSQSSDVISQEFDVSYEHTTPSKKGRPSRKGKIRGKNLSTSFNLLQSEFEEEVCYDSNDTHIEFKMRSQCTQQFPRTDSGFNEDTTSNYSYMEHFEPIDEKVPEMKFDHMPLIKAPLKTLTNRMVLKSRRSSIHQQQLDTSDAECHEHDITMQSESDFQMCSRN